MAGASLGNNKDNISTSSNFDTESCLISSPNSRICICLLCGLPGSGKTTLLRSLTYKNNRYSSSKLHSNYVLTDSSKLALDHLVDKPGKYAVVGIEYDSILPVHQFNIERSDKIQELELSGTWKGGRNQILSATEALLQHICFNSRAEFPVDLQLQGSQAYVWKKFKEIYDSIKTEIENNEIQILLVVDDNMYFRSMRYEYYKLARKYQTGYCQIHVKCSIDKAMERNKSREESNQVPGEIILRMSERLEPPDPELYNWETNSITVSSDVDINIDQIYGIVQKALMNRVQPVEELNEEESFASRIACSTSVLHQADLILRKCVATKMADLKLSVRPEQIKDLSRQVCQVKDKIISDLKNGEIPLVLLTDLTVANASHDPSNTFFRLLEDTFLKEMSRS